MTGTFTIVPYTWRGKSYKTIRGLHNALLKAYPSCALSFGQGEMHLIWRDKGQVSKRLIFNVVRNHPTANEIAEQPK